MITDSYDIQTEPMFSLKDFYGEQKHIVNTCLVLFSSEIQKHLLDTFECSVIGKMMTCREVTPIYQLTYENRKIAFYLSQLGSAMAADYCAETWWLTGAENFVMFGSCGSLNREKTFGKFILPEFAYRGEGFSYYFAAAEDYIQIKNCDSLARIFDELHLPYVKGRVWTTDTMLRETYGLVNKRREEGCIAVEMEVAGVQSVCDFYGLQLYDFLEAGDVLGETDYEPEGLPEANHGLGKLYIGLKAAAMIDSMNIKQQG